jgi:hypothetical protein
MRLIIVLLTLILLINPRLTFAAEEKNQPSSMALAAWHYCNYDIEKLHHLKPITSSTPLLSQGSDKRNFWILCMRSRELEFSDKCDLSVQYQKAICWNSATKSKSLLEKLFSK